MHLFPSYKRSCAKSRVLLRGGLWIKVNALSALLGLEPSREHRRFYVVQC